MSGILNFFLLCVCMCEREFYRISHVQIYILWNTKNIQFVTCRSRILFDASHYTDINVSVCVCVLFDEESKATKRERVKTPYIQNRYANDICMYMTHILQIICGWNAIKNCQYSIIYNLA